MSIAPIIHQCECQACQAGVEAEIIQGHQRVNLFLSRLNEPQKRWYVATLSEESNGPSDRQLALHFAVQGHAVALLARRILRLDAG